MLETLDILGVMNKPKVTFQGTAVIEEVDGGDVLLMLPNGDVSAHASVDDATKVAAKWFKQDAKKRNLGIGVGITEQR